MELQIVPEPSEGEAEAIAEALAAARAAHDEDGRTPWWRAGVCANVAVNPEAERDLG